MTPAEWARKVAPVLALLAGGAPCLAEGQPPAAPEPLSECAGEGEPYRVLEAFWSELDRRYAVFPQRLGDRSWAAIGRAACARISSGMSDAELYEVLLGMARELDDGHTRIVAPELGRRDAAWVTGYAHGEVMARLAGNVEAHYADRPLSRDPSNWFSWGRIGKFGYRSLAAFEGLSPTVVESDDVAAATAVMAQVMRDLEGARGLVVDIRANEGGWDEVQLAVARWFSGGRRLAYRKSRRVGPDPGDLGPPEEVFVAPPVPGAFAGPVVVLTTGWTFSAAETFALAMRTRPGTWLLGEPTSGHFSDLEPGTLPNGWTFTYSAELYRAADGEVYETRGVPPDLPVAFDADAFAAGRDLQLEAALSRLRTDLAEE